MRGPDPTVDQVLAAVAASQHGIVTRQQALAEGISARQVETRLRKGSLIAVHPGVYRVGHAAPSVEATYMAAVLRCGDGALLSGRAAGHLLGLLPGPAPPPEVTAPRERRIKGVGTRCSRRLDPADRVICRGIPTTSPAATLVDLAAVVAPHLLGRAVHEAGIRHGVGPEAIAAVLDRRPNAPGSGKLRAILSGDAGLTLSKLEREFLKLLRKAGLPLPVTNSLAGGRLVDCRWPAHKLTVELDGYRYHASRHAWEQDRRRERQAYARGDQFRRFTWGDVIEHPKPLLRELRAVLR